jgi:hypothetical protein
MSCGQFQAGSTKAARSIDDINNRGEEAMFCGQGLLLVEAHMKFVLVNGRRPRPETCCALCCEPIGESYLRELTSRLSYCSYECYRGHCKLAMTALTERARAS